MLRKPLHQPISSLKQHAATVGAAFFMACSTAVAARSLGDDLFVSSPRRLPEKNCGNAKKQPAVANTPPAAAALWTMQNWLMYWCWLHNLVGLFVGFFHLLICFSTPQRRYQANQPAGSAKVCAGPMETGRSRSSASLCDLMLSVAASAFAVFSWVSLFCFFDLVILWGWKVACTGSQTTMLQNLSHDMTQWIHHLHMPLTKNMSWVPRPCLWARAIAPNSPGGKHSCKPQKWRCLGPRRSINPIAKTIKTPLQASGRDRIPSCKCSTHWPWWFVGKGWNMLDSKLWSLGQMLPRHSFAQSIFHLQYVWFIVIPGFRRWSCVSCVLYNASI